MSMNSSNKEVKLFIKDTIKINRKRNLNYFGKEV